MAKSFKRSATVYHVKARYFNRAEFKPVDIEFDIDSKNKRNIIKYVLAHYENCKNGTDIDIVTITSSVNTTTVTIHATLDDIIKACKAANITVDEVAGDNADATDDNDSDDTATEDSNNSDDAATADSNN